MDSWKHCPECNNELAQIQDEIFPFHCRKCNETYSRGELESLYKEAQEATRLAAVRELVSAYKEIYGLEHVVSGSLALAALAAVWPEAVGE